ncbi:MAG: DUF4443 domain-containing protein [Nitrososphaerales archaeon]
MSLSDIIYLLQERYPGPAITFNVFHIIKALLLLGDKVYLSRSKLAKELSIGDGAVRTLIDRMRKAEWIEIDKKGCKLKDKGFKIYKKIKAKIPKMSFIKGGKLALDKQNFALLIRKASSKISLGLEQRDAAVRAGATGAITLVYKGDKFYMAGEKEDCEKRYPNGIWIKLREILSPKEDDVIIIAGGRDSKDAEYGALAAAWSTLSEKKKSKVIR